MAPWYAQLSRPTSAVRNLPASSVFELPISSLRLARRAARLARHAAVDKTSRSVDTETLVVDVLSAINTKGPAYLKTPDQQRVINCLLDKLSSLDEPLNQELIPGNYVLEYMSSKNSLALSKSRVERLLRNSALRKVAQLLPLSKAVGSITQSKVFDDFARNSFRDADLDGDGRLTKAEFWVCMLLMYNKVNVWLPFKAAPPNKQEIQDVFHFYDCDESDTLSFEEFKVIVKALLADEQSLSDSFAYRWVKTFVGRLWIEPFEVVMNFLPKSVVDTSLLSTEQSLGISRALLERQEVLQAVRDGQAFIACQFRILRALPGCISVSGRLTVDGQGVATSTVGRPQISLPGGVHLTFGHDRRSSYVLAYVDSRIKIIVGEQGTYYLFTRAAADDPRFADILESGRREMSPGGRLLLASLTGALAAGGAALWSHDQVAFLTATAVLGTLVFAVAEQVALNAMQFGNEVSGAALDSVEGDEHFQTYQ